MKDTRQFILDTLLDYKINTKNCAINSNGGCSYLTENGKKCAVGKHMVKGEHQYYEDSFIHLICKYNREEFFTKKALKQNLDNYTWSTMQSYHDALAYFSRGKADKQEINKYVYLLETHLDIKLPELLIEE